METCASYGKTSILKSWFQCLQGEERICNPMPSTGVPIIIRKPFLRKVRSCHRSVAYTRILPVEDEENSTCYYWISGSGSIIKKLNIIFIPNFNPEDKAFIRKFPVDYGQLIKYLDAKYNQKYMQWNRKSAHGNGKLTEAGKHFPQVVWPRQLEYNDVKYLEFTDVFG